MSKVGEILGEVNQGKEEKELLNVSAEIIVTIVRAKKLFKKYGYKDIVGDLEDIEGIVDNIRSEIQSGKAYKK